MAGVNIKEPRRMVERNGSPKSRKGCFCSALRYFAASELGSVALKDLDVNGPGMASVDGWRAQAGGRAIWASMRIYSAFRD